jgi:glutathione S-transferase
VNVRLYTLHGSHPGVTAKLMLERKGIPYKLTLLPPGFSRRLIKRFGFEGDRTPAMKIDGRKVQGSMQIARELERVQPAPPLFPADPDQRQRVEEAELWGDEFQSIPRTIIWWAFTRDRTGMKSFLESAPASARFGLPAGMAVKTTGPIISLATKLNDANDDHVRAELAQLPDAFDRIDRWIEEGVLDGQELTAADYQIAPSIRLLMTFDDLRPSIEARPAGKLAKRVLPQEPGRIPPVFPREWLTLPVPAPA